MHTRQPISIGKLQLDTSNYRITKRDNQKEARAAIIAEQGRKLVYLAKDIIEHGINPIDQPLVIDANDGNGNFIVIEGNRRLTALQLLLTPELAKDTQVYKSFVKLNREHADSIPKVLDCVIVPSKKAGLVWINRKHASGLEGAGTEPWSAMAKARADAEQGVARPDLDVVNFVMANATIDDDLRLFLEGSKFNITTLQRLIEAREVQETIGFTVPNGRVITSQSKERMVSIFKDFVEIIATGKIGSDKFTERQVDTDVHRAEFLDKVLPNHPKKNRGGDPWQVASKPAKIESSTKKQKQQRGTPSTDDRPNLIPKTFKLELPPGKVNDIFMELKGLDATSRRHAVSVLFRVFIELSLNAYIEKHAIELQTDGKGHVVDKMSARLKKVVDHVKSTKLLNASELKPIHVAIGDNNSVLAPDTLNAYVHSEWMNPDPLNLKLAWNNCQLFIERLWTSKK